MAAIIGNISRLFQPTIGVLAAEKICRGINSWYFLIGLRMVMLFLAFGPWDSLKVDLACQWPSSLGDSKLFCAALCFNQQFPIPFTAIWSFYFIAIIWAVALMKFVYVTVEDKKASGKDVEKAVEPKPVYGTSATPERREPAGQQFGGWRYGIYILCIVLILAMELSFIWALLGLQLPIMNQRVTTCNPNNPACPEGVQCALNARADKRAVLWALAFCSAANASFCIGYLATLSGQSCGCCGGGGDGRDRARAQGQADCRAEAVGYGCHCNGAGCSSCQGSTGEWPGMYSCPGDGGVGMAGCGCQPGVNCCCRHNNGQEVASCGCQNYRRCPCYFQGSEAGQKRNSLCSREDSDGKLLKGDTEVKAERKEWQAHDGRMQMREPLRTVAKRGRSSPAGGRAVKYVAKYQVWGKRKL